MQTLHPRPSRRKVKPTRTVFVGRRGFKRRYKWSRPFSVSVYRQQPLELAVSR